MWGVLMGEITDSSLMAEGGKNACWVFAMMIAKADKDHCIRKDPRTFAREIDVTWEEWQAAIDIITRPDPHSNITAYEGRRAIPLSELDMFAGNRGFFIVNREHYINLIGSSSKHRVVKHRKKVKITEYFSNLQKQGVTVALSNASLSIFTSTSISIEVIKYLIECGVDLDVWAEFEAYRTAIKHPLKLDQGRNTQINKLKGRKLAEQREILKFCIDHEHRKLIPPEERFENQKQKGGPGGTVNGKQSDVKTYIVNGDAIVLPGLHEDNKNMQLAAKLGVSLRGLTREESRHRLIRRLEDLERE